MTRGRVSWLLTILLMLSSACKSPTPATEVLVVVHGNVRGGEDVTKLHVSVRTPDGDEDNELESYDFNVAAKPGRAKYHALPFSYSLTPDGYGDSATFRLVLTGQNGKGEETIERQVKAAFRPGVRTLLAVELDRSCLDKLCREEDDQTCIQGVCKPVSTVKLTTAEEGELGGFKATKSDGGPKPDAAPGPSCEQNSDCEERAASATPEGCLRAECVEGACTFAALDRDGDQHGGLGCQLDGFEVQGDDCDDADPTVYPGAWDGPLVADLHADSCRDGRDNDCDGTADNGSHEGATCMCDPATDLQVDCSLRPDGTVIMWPLGQPVGRCEYGKRSCKNGEWGKCTGAVEPAQDDSCNDDINADATCDGKKNVGCDCVSGQGRECGSDTGSCIKGRQTCVDETWSELCVGEVRAQATDGCDPMNDDNCNGKPNEGCECVNGSSTTCALANGAKGVCGTRAVQCKNGKWDTSGCSRTQPETCGADWLDENCNGQPNEGCECTDGDTQSCGELNRGLKGACADGRVSCAGGKWGACNTTPAPGDSCGLFANGDENCNGIPLEGCECTELMFRDCYVGPCMGGQWCGASGTWGACDATCTDGGV